MTISDVLTRVLIPVARLAMARGMGVRDVLDPLKRAFLTVAQERAAARITDSRLSVLTGLQRRDVVRLREQVAASPAPPAPARLLQAWPQGVARLPRMGDTGSFEALARDIRQDVHPRTMLDLLSEAGAIAVEGEAVRLIRRDFLPAGGSPEQLTYLAENLHDHGSAAVTNVTAQGSHFDRAAHFTGLHAADVEALAAFHREAETAILMEIAERTAKMDGTGTCRVRFGGYAYSEDTT
ncbi:MAG: hypothetical protein AAFY65_05985 [Pseudomonadota bacterium]